MYWWVRLYFDHTSYVMGCPLRHSWPARGGVGAQDGLLVQMFMEIEAGVLKQMELDRGRP